MAADSNFHVVDYVVFGAMLLISAGIGVYYAVVGGRQKSTKEFLMANRSMRSLPVALSVLASFFSASTLLGTPAEIYEYGTQYWISVFGAVLAPVTGALLFGPMFFSLKIVSVFEYLELRFKSKAVRLFGALLFILRATMGMGIVLYGPSTALSAVTPFPVWAIILVVGGVCTFYTTLGGMKAVIWTDVFQTLVMLAGMLAVFIQGSIRVGGLTEMWRISYEGGRINFFNFDPDPHVRQTFWSLTVGIYFVWMYPYTVDQQMVQRFSSARSLKDARFALLCNVPGMFILITLCSLTGLSLYANYATCDPLKNKDVSNPNQLLPNFVMEVFGGLPGLPGLFVACMFSGALSSVSSMLNSLAAVTWEDFVKLKLGAVSDSRATLITKVLVLLFGILGIGMAFAVKQMGGTVLQASLTFNGSAGAPLVGMFILGACFTSSNWIILTDGVGKFPLVVYLVSTPFFSFMTITDYDLFLYSIIYDTTGVARGAGVAYLPEHLNSPLVLDGGALVGGIVGFAIPMWGGIGKYTSASQSFKLPTTILGCNSTNLTDSYILHTGEYNASKTTQDVTMDGMDKFYGLSYLWFSAIGVLITVGIGLTLSWATGCNKSDTVDEELQLKVFERICSCFCYPVGSIRHGVKIKKENRSRIPPVVLTSVDIPLNKTDSSASPK